MRAAISANPSFKISVLSAGQSISTHSNIGAKPLLSCTILEIEKQWLRFLLSCQNSWLWWRWPNRNIHSNFICNNTIINCDSLHIAVLHKSAQSLVAVKAACSILLLSSLLQSISKRYWVCVKSALESPVLFHSSSYWIKTDFAWERVSKP